MTDVNRSLTHLVAIQLSRRELDAAERELIEDARESGASWAAIAQALGVRSRQAAEQRWLRLCTNDNRDPRPERARRRIQRESDAFAGQEIVKLRAAVIAEHRDFDGTDLVKQTLAAAVDAPPGALYDLAKQAVCDSPSHRLPLVREALLAIS